MKLFIKSMLPALCLLLILQVSAQNIFSVVGNKTYLNGHPFQSIGLRCSNALLTDSTTKELIHFLDVYASYGINTITVYFMGSRYSKIHGYRTDGSLNDTYAARMEKIIKACDERSMIVLVGVLYWGSGPDVTNYYRNWTQSEANAAMRHTVAWLGENNFQNVFVDPDNEGMAERGLGINIDEMICAAKNEASEVIVAYNGKGYPPPCADLSIHFGFPTKSKPYIETEGTPSRYWGDYSKEDDLQHYINVGIYTDGKKAEQLARTKELLNMGHGYLLASTWLQNIPPNYHPGGDGSPCNPGIQWWLDFIRDHFKNQ
ncbi:MAG: hypothetical protein HKN87_22165 [Saprospiraceae bacterium]|nr:hypothetical protein [Saprospiraceae bacterium]